MSRYLVPLLMVVGLVRTQDSSTNSTGELSLPNPKVCTLCILQSSCIRTDSTEPLFLNVYGAQESIPAGWLSIPGLLKKIYKYGLYTVEP
jgi:hypothetical protein